MNAMRYLPRVDYKALKTTSGLLVNELGGPTEAARISRVSQPLITRYCSHAEEYDERFMPIDVVADLEAATGNPILARKLAELSGSVLVPLPISKDQPGKLDAVTGQALQEVGEVFTGLGQARGDGRITRDEAKALRKEIREAHAMLARLGFQIEAEVDDD